MDPCLVPELESPCSPFSDRPLLSLVYCMTHLTVFYTPVFSWLFVLGAESVEWLSGGVSARLLDPVVNHFSGGSPAEQLLRGWRAMRLDRCLEGGDWRRLPPAKLPFGWDSGGFGCLAHQVLCLKTHAFFLLRWFGRGFQVMLVGDQLGRPSSAVGSFGQSNRQGPMCSPFGSKDSGLFFFFKGGGGSHRIWFLSSGFG